MTSFPHINGLQCTLLSENYAFDAQQHEALRIHFVAGNHWVASSSFGQQVTVYDSKYGGKLHPSLTHQIARIYRSLETDEDGDLMLEIKVPTVQQQFGSCDCGLFVIAFTLHLALAHFLRAVSDEISSSQVLPKEEDGTISTQEGCFYPNRECTFFPILELFCICHMPETYDDMVQWNVESGFT